MSDDTAPALQLLDAFTTAWCARDASAVTALFDADDIAVTCLLADAIDPAIGMSAIGADLATRCAATTRIVLRCHDIAARRLADEVISAFFLVDRGHTDSGGVLIGRQVRATLVARRRPTGWRIAHYAEAPLAPLLELQAYYERVAAAGLDAIPPRPWTMRAPS